MQIFVSDPCPELSAQALDDSRLNKMILESSQLMSAALHLNGVTEKLPSGPGWKNHPLARWTARARGNYVWLFKHFIALNREFIHRRGKTHSYAQHVDFFFDHLRFIPAGDLESFVNCTTLKDRKDSIFIIYRDYLNWKWNNDKRIPRWTNRKAPSWRQT